MNNTLKSILLENIKNDIIANDITMESVMTIHSNKNELFNFNRNLFFI